MDICGEHGIPEELRYANTKQEPILGNMMQRIMKNFYSIARSSETCIQQRNKCEGKIRYLKYGLKRRMIQINAPDLLWGFCIVTQSEIMYRVSIGGHLTDFEVLNGDSVDIREYTLFELYDLVWYWDKPEAI